MEEERNAESASDSGTLALQNVIDALAEGEPLQRALGAVAQSSHILLTVEDLDAAIPRVLRTLGESLRIDSVRLFRVEGDRGSGDVAYVYVAGWFASPLPESPPRWTLATPTIREWDERLDRGHTLRGRAADQSPEVRSVMERNLAESFLIVPVPGERHPWGCIGLTSSDGERVWDEAEEAALMALAASLGGAIHRKSAEQREIELQRKLLAVRRMESLGVLARGVAHDFNHVLTLLSGHLQLLHRDATLSDDSRDRLRHAMLAADGAADLIRQLRIYAGQAELHRREVSVPNLLRETAMLVQPMLTGKISIDLDLARDLPLLSADATQLRQVFMNLMRNAAEAMEPNEGAIRVRAQVFDGRDSGNGARAVAVEVADTGPGIAPQERERIFEPFYSTKGEGRGLGLAAVQAIVRAHDGRVDLECVEGEGSTFRVLLPLGE